MRFLTRLFRVRTGWARRVGYLELTRSQIRRLEAIRQGIGVSDEVFLLQIASDPEGTKRLQRFIHGWLKRKTPEKAGEAPIGQARQEPANSGPARWRRFVRSRDRSAN